MTDSMKMVTEEWDQSEVLGDDITKGKYMEATKTRKEENRRFGSF